MTASPGAALVTGAARGQGRAHAVTLARLGYDVVCLDVPEGLTTLTYETASDQDLQETCQLIEKLDRRAVPITADVRSAPALHQAIDAATELGDLSVVVANAGICSFASFEDITDEQWDEMIAVNLTGVFRTLRAAIPIMRAQGHGRLLATASMAGRGGSPHLAHYAATKAGVISLIKTLALELGASGVTANVLCPTTVDTPMVHNAPMYGLFAPDVTSPTKENVTPRYAAMNPMRVPWLEPQEVADAMAYLVSDAARHVSGLVFEVSSGGGGAQL
jgi:SDR family mycofactocin-dependent oxidoreductase